MKREITPEYGDEGSCRGPNTLKYRVVTARGRGAGEHLAASLAHSFQPYGANGASTSFGLAVGVSPKPTRAEHDPNTPARGHQHIQRAADWR
jgi:hypothetical protein